VECTERSRRDGSLWNNRPVALFDVILPAGGCVDEAFAAEVGTTNKAIIAIGGQTVLGRTIDALRSLADIGRIAVIGPQEVLDHPDAAKADFKLIEGATGPENIFKGLEALTGEPLKHGSLEAGKHVSDDRPRRILIVTTDLPFLSPEVLTKYIELCPKDKDFTIPLVGRNAWNALYPGLGATFVKLKDGEWTTGCAYIATVEGLRKARPHIERVFENRKSKLGMAKLLGPGFVFKWLTKRLTVADVEKKVRQLLDCSGVAVPNSPPELAYDIDYLDDYHYALKLIKENQA
jgi:CTP:molybdopterin cytidylyltransferase MocA